MKRILVVLGVLVALGIAFVHWVLPGRVEASMNTVLEHPDYKIGEQAQRLHDSLFVVDLHSDSLLWKRDLTKESAIGHVDIPRLKAGNVALQVFSATTKSPADLNYSSNTDSSDDITLLAVASFWPPRTWFSLFERAAYQNEKLHRFADASDLVLIENKQDLQRLVAARANGEKLVGALYLIEGAHPLEGNIENLDRLFDKGLRIAGLTHFFDNELGGSAHGQSQAGLTAFGKEVVNKMNEKGIFIDLAHCSPAIVDDVLAMTDKPVIVSHTGVRGVLDSPRNLSDLHIQKIAENGGIIGIAFFDEAVGVPELPNIIASIKHVRDLVGIEYVALGSDYDGAVAVPFDITGFPLLVEGMMNQGFNETEIQAVMGENIKRFFLQNLN